MRLPAKADFPVTLVNGALLPNKRWLHWRNDNGWSGLLVSIAVSITLCTTITACSLLPSRPQPPAVHDFGLKTINPSENAPWASIKVEAPEWLQTESIHYRLLYAEPTRVRAYANDRWIAPPPALLAQRLEFEGGGKGYGLKIKLLEFEQVFTAPQQATLVLALRALAHPLGEEGPGAEKVFRLERRTPTADAHGAVMAAHAMVDEAVRALAVWLREQASTAARPAK